MIFPSVATRNAALQVLLAGRDIALEDSVQRDGVAAQADNFVAHLQREPKASILSLLPTTPFPDSNCASGLGFLAPDLAPDLAPPGTPCHAPRHNLCSGLSPALQLRCSGFSNSSTTLCLPPNIVLIVPAQEPSSFPYTTANSSGERRRGLSSA